MAGIGEISNQSVYLECDEVDPILAWLDELQCPCEAKRLAVITAHLADALEGFMGINRELLDYHFQNSTRGYKASGKREKPVPFNESGR